MREEIEIKGSVDYDKISDRLSSALTGIPSEDVNTHDFVNSVLTLRRFRSELQRVSEEHRLKAEEVAESEGRRTFNEVLDVYEFCYDFVKDLSRRLKVPMYKVPEKVEKFLPKDLEDQISMEVSELLEKFSINNGDLAPVGAAISKILREVVLKRRPAVEVVKPLLLLEEGEEDV